MEYRTGSDRVVVSFDDPNLVPNLSRRCRVSIYPLPIGGIEA